MPPALTNQKRLLSLDAYRGFTMFLMVSAGFGLSVLADNPSWAWLARQVDHTAWAGCNLWDLIQPSFIFIVGVAMPFAFAIRQGRGETRAQMFRHAFKRSFMLLFLGVIRVCMSDNKLIFDLTTVLQQIAVAYFLAFFVLGRGMKVQLITALLILISDWALFQFWPGVGPGGPYAINANFHSAVELWVFGHQSPGGYTGFNAWGSTATVIFGIMAGELLRKEIRDMSKVWYLVLAGIAGIIIGLLLGPFIPVVKKIWTPSWTIFSAGWGSLLLAVFYWTIEIRNWRKWCFVFMVVGMNSIAIYMIVSFLRGSVDDWLGVFTRGFLEPLGSAGVIIQSCLVLAVFWYITYWMYKRQIFLKVG
jgi:heparan-alpha-glucosaminide N-acetyltransferase